jgi:murein DD-endopeptidase MepM/ murein hydrolase activator NlpD
VGTPVLAAAAGRVSYVGYLGGYGIAIIIDHGNGLQTRYGHLSQSLVSVGQNVSAGQQIARSGSTGMSTGPHLHFEVRVNDRAVDPMGFLKR